MLKLLNKNSFTVLSLLSYLNGGGNCHANFIVARFKTLQVIFSIRFHIVFDLNGSSFVSRIFCLFVLALAPFRIDKSFFRKVSINKPSCILKDEPYDLYTYPIVSSNASVLWSSSECLFSSFLRSYS